MEIVNQNQINTTQERLNEMKKLKQDNEQVLADIQKLTDALNQSKGKFETYKQGVEAKLAADRELLAREQDNSLPHVEYQKNVDVLNVQIKNLTTENDDLKLQIATLTTDVEDLKKHIQESALQS